MLALIENLSFQITLIIAFGALLGNFTTSLLYRIPRGIKLNAFDEKKGQGPMCSFCFKVLKYYEYLPILNLMFTRGKCRGCKAAIPRIYFLLELIGAINSLVFFSIFGLGDEYFLFLTFASLILLQATIYTEHKIHNTPLNNAIIALGAMFHLSINYVYFSDIALNFAIFSIVYMIIIKLNLGILKNKKQLFHYIILSSAWIHDIFATSIYLSATLLTMFLLTKYSKASPYNRYTYSIMLVLLVLYSTINQYVTYKIPLHIIQ